MGIPDHLTCLLRSLYAGQEATVRIELEQWTISKLGKEYIWLYIVTLTNFYAEYIMQMWGWMNHKLESRLPGEISITSDMQMTLP